MRKVVDDNSATKFNNTATSIEPKVRNKRRKKRRDLEQIRRNVLDARKNLRRERKQAGTNPRKGLKTSFNRTLENFADIRQKNEDKTQGVENCEIGRSEKKTLCKRLLCDSEIGIFRNGAKGKEVKRRTNVASEPAEARLPGDVMKLLDGDDTSPRKSEKNRKKANLEEEKRKSNSPPPFHVNSNKESPGRNKPQGFKRISEEENFVDKHRIDKYKKRLFENDEESDNESIDLYRMEPLRFSPRTSRVDEIETEGIPKSAEGKSSSTDTHSHCSIDRWRWSPVSCFEELCAEVCVDNFTDFIENCYVTDPEKKCRKVLSALIEKAKSSQSQNERETLSDVEKSYSTQSFSDNGTITCKDQCCTKYEPSYEGTSQPSLTSHHTADEKSDIPCPPLHQYPRNVTGIVTPQNRVVEKTARAGRVALEQSVRKARNSRKISTFDVRRGKSGGELKKVGIGRSTLTHHERVKSRDCDGVRIQCHQVHLPNTSPEAKGNRSGLNIKRVHVQSQQPIEESSVYYRGPSPPNDWANTQETRTEHFPSRIAKHVPSILRRSSNDKKVRFELNLQKSQPGTYPQHVQDQRVRVETPREIRRISTDRNSNQSKNHLLTPMYNVGMPHHLFENLGGTSGTGDQTGSNITENFHIDHFQDYRHKKNDLRKKTKDGNDRHAVKNLKPVKKHSYDPSALLVVEEPFRYNPTYHPSQIIRQENSGYFNSELAMNDAVLRGLKILSFSEEQRNQAQYMEHEKALGRFPSTQPMKYMAVSAENDQSRPQRIPVYPNAGASGEQELHETLTHYEPYTRINQTQPSHPLTIYPSNQNLPMENNELHRQHSRNYNVWPDNRFLHNQSSSENNQIRPGEVLRNMPYTQNPYELSRGRSEPSGIKLNDRSVSFSAPEKIEYCRNKDCVRCLDRKNKAVRFF